MADEEEAAALEEEPNQVLARLKHLHFKAHTQQVYGRGYTGQKNGFTTSERYA